MATNLRKSRLRKSEGRKDFNPMEGALNIVDVMLVFACGLMLSLIINWNVDVGGQDGMVEMTRRQEISQVQEAKENLLENKDDPDFYEKMGTVYKDSKTGRLFMLTDK